MRSLNLNKKIKGQAMTEFLIISFVLLLLTLGLVQLVFVYQTKTNVNYAMYEAIRAGTLANANPIAIKHGFARGMAPSHVRVVADPDKSSVSSNQLNAALATAYERSYKEIDQYVLFERLSPTTSMFGGGGSSWGQPIPDWEITQKGIQGLATKFYIPNHHLLYQQTTLKSGISIQDANLLKLRVTYCMELIVPFANIVFENAYKLIFSKTSNHYLTNINSLNESRNEKVSKSGFSARCISDDSDRRIPIVASSIMRMQSPARNYTF